jgi:long-chain fatty acid transport protein
MKSTHLRRCLISTFILSTGAGIFYHTKPAVASGFALVEQDVPSLGNAFSGSSAVVNDASTIFFNPAGLTRFQGNSFSAAAFAIFPSARFKKQSAVTVIGTPLLGGNGGDGGVDVIVPATYASWSVTDRLKLGIGINSPFGLATQYPADWVGRYQAVESRLSTININPTVAYKVTNELSVGAGLNIQEVSAVLSSAIDFGLIAGRAGFPLLPQSADGFLKVGGSDWSLGYNLGILYEPTRTTRFGLSYRSPITHTLKGYGDFTVPPIVAPITATGRFINTGASTELKLPGLLSFGVYHEVTPQVALVASIDWTN